MSKVWIITTKSQISNLVALAQGRETTALVIGDAQVKGVDQVLRVALPENQPVEALAPELVSLVEAQAGDLVLACNGAAERAIAGAVAAKLGLPVLVGLSKVDGNRAVLSSYGGISVEEVDFNNPVVAVVEGGAEVEDGASPAEEAVSVSAGYGCQIVSTDQNAGESVNLGAARKIVAVGRGFAAEEDLQMARDFAASIGAEMACSRPLAEGTGWMSRESYIGISGQHVSPDVYYAIGISGQIQHVSGMSETRTIVAINKDDKAPIFEVCDYGIVGDLYQVLPALNEEVK